MSRHTANVYVGVFDSEVGQRFLYGLRSLTDVALLELWKTAKSRAQYAQFLQCVAKWSSVLLQQQIHQTHEAFPDFSVRFYDVVDAFKQQVHTTTMRTELRRKAAEKAAIARGEVSAADAVDRRRFEPRASNHWPSSYSTQNMLLPLPFPLPPALRTRVMVPVNVP